MATDKFELNLPDIPYKGKKIILEYIFVNHTKYELHAKTKIVEFEPKSVQECPVWDNYMWNDLEMKDFREMLLKPVAMFENPFFLSPHKLVLCDMWLDYATPAAINTRHSCKKTMERLKNDPVTGYMPKQPHDPWFGIEQEYFVTGNDGIPISFDPKNNDYATLILYSRIGHPHDKNIGVERELSSQHLKACLYAGIEIGGRMRENACSQWEFQIGPCQGETIGDHLHVARYILIRLAEMFGMRVSFKPMPVKDEALSSGGHLNFSTKRMREEGGMKFIKQAIDLLSKSNQEPLLEMYDPTNENKERLSNTSAHWHPRKDDFFCDVANKEFTTVRIPPLVGFHGYGYFEDRRPSSQIDPYAASEGIVRACIFGDFLKPGFESLKDLKIWDE